MSADPVAFVVARNAVERALVMARDDSRNAGLPAGEVYAALMVTLVDSAAAMLARITELDPDEDPEPLLAAIQDRLRDTFVVLLKRI